MLIKVLHVCYDPSHNAINVKAGPIKIEDVDSTKPGTKIVRAILRASGLEVEDYLEHELHRCFCNRDKGRNFVANRSHPPPSVTKLDQQSLVADLDLTSGDRIFIKPSKGKAKAKASPVKRSASSSTSKGDTSSPQKKRPRKSARTEPEEKAAAAAGVEKNDSWIASHGLNTPHGLTGGNWTASSAAIRDSITEILGGNRWLNQKIVDGVSLTSRSEPRLRALRRAIALALECPESKKEKRDGGLPKILCQGIVKAFRGRLQKQEASGEPVTGGRAQHLKHIGLNDLDDTVEWLVKRLEDPSAANESELEDYDEDAAGSEDGGPPELTRSAQSTVKRLSELWRNDKWINQSPLPGLAPISVSNNLNNGRLRKMAELTKVKASHVQPDGLPNQVLRALRQVILSQTDDLVGNAKHGWSQSKCIPLALELLQKGKVSKKPVPPLPANVDSYAKSRANPYPFAKRAIKPTASTSETETKVFDKVEETSASPSDVKPSAVEKPAPTKPAPTKRIPPPPLSSRKLVPYSRPSTSGRTSLRTNPIPVASTSDLTKGDDGPSPYSLLQQCRTAFNATASDFGYSLEQEVEVLAKMSELEVLLDITKPEDAEEAKAAK